MRHLRTAVTVRRQLSNAALLYFSHRNGHEYLAQSLAHFSNDQTGSPRDAIVDQLWDWDGRCFIPW